MIFYILLILLTLNGSQLLSMEYDDLNELEKKINDLWASNEGCKDLLEILKEYSSNQEMNIFTMPTNQEILNININDSNSTTHKKRKEKKIVTIDNARNIRCKICAKQHKPTIYPLPKETNGQTIIDHIVDKHISTYYYCRLCKFQLIPYKQNLGDEYISFLRLHATGHFEGDIQHENFEPTLLNQKRRKTKEISRNDYLREQP